MEAFQCFHNLNASPLWSSSLRSYKELTRVDGQEYMVDHITCFKQNEIKSEFYKISNFVKPLQIRSRDFGKPLSWKLFQFLRKAYFFRKLILPKKEDLEIYYIILISILSSSKTIFVLRNNPLEEKLLPIKLSFVKTLLEALRKVDALKISKNSLKKTHDKFHL